MVLASSWCHYRGLSLFYSLATTMVTKKIPLKKFAGGVVNQLR